MDSEVAQTPTKQNSEAVEGKHLQGYVAEFNYRLNRRDMDPTCSRDSLEPHSPHKPSPANNLSLRLNYWIII